MQSPSENDNTSSLGSRCIGFMPVWGVPQTGMSSAPTKRVQTSIENDIMDADTLAAAQARHANGKSPTQIAEALGVSRASIYRHLPTSNT